MCACVCMCAPKLAWFPWASTHCYILSFPSLAHLPTRTGHPIPCPPGSGSGLCFPSPRARHSTTDRQHPPDSATSEMGTPCSWDIKPRMEKTTNPATKLVALFRKQRAMESLGLQTRRGNEGQERGWTRGKRVGGQSQGPRRQEGNGDGRARK